MGVGSQIRFGAFRAVDWMRGSAASHALADLDRLQKLQHDAPELLAYRDSALTRLMAHAQQTTVAYRNCASELSQLPSVSKAQLHANRTQYLSSAYRDKTLIPVKTSGSTGTPFVWYQNAEKRRRVHAEVIHFSRTAGYEVGEQLIYLRAIAEGAGKHPLLQWAQNEKLIDVADLSPMGVSRILRTIDSVATRAGVTVLSYASTLDAIAACAEENRDAFPQIGNVKGVISISETLSEVTRERIQNVLGTTCLSRYSNQENGILAQEGPQPGGFFTNDTNYLVEVLEFESDRVAAVGEAGRIVITDLFNFAMPMLRYDTGDVAAIEITWDAENCVNRRTLVQLSGRRVDMVFDVDDQVVSPHMITNTFWRFSQVRQYQFIQVAAGDYLVRLNADFEDVDLDGIHAALTTFLGAAATIGFEHASEIPVLQSGKRKSIVSLYDPRESERNQLEP
jgi:phenylacetate-CoA ligase